MEAIKTISEDDVLAMSNAMAMSRYMREYATVYESQGRYAFRLTGDPRPLIADQIIWSNDPQMRDRAVVFSRVA
jgi:hypothetical protein